MNDELKILAGFLAKYSEDVEGRSAEEPPTEIVTRIQAFAAGKLAEQDRVALSEKLKENPHWVPHLAQAARRDGQ